jgi:cell division protein FtsN
MSEPAFREIQLSGKQVVFLFMAGAVAAVVIFLLGVSVGRGVIAGTDPQATPPALAGSGGAAAPTSTPAAGELQYHDTLQGKPPAPAPPIPTPSATPAPAGEAKPQPTNPPAPSSKPAASAAPTPAAPAKPAPTPAAGEGWYVQVDSFSSRDNASRQVADLKTRGYAASVFTARGTPAPYKVRIGPMDRAAADAMIARLRKEGFKPSPVR